MIKGEDMEAVRIKNIITQSKTYRSRERIRDVEINKVFAGLANSRSCDLGGISSLRVGRERLHERKKVVRGEYDREHAQAR